MQFIANLKKCNLINVPHNTKLIFKKNNLKNICIIFFFIDQVQIWTKLFIYIGYYLMYSYGHTYILCLRYVIYILYTFATNFSDHIHFVHIILAPIFVRRTRQSPKNIPRRIRIPITKRWYIRRGNFILYYYYFYKCITI